MIAYHGGPMGGPVSEAVRFYRGRHMMLSFAYPDHLPAVAETAKTFTLDNGAFTTWKSGKPFDLNGYDEFVNEWYRHPGFAWCLIPDVIDGTAEDNDDMIERWMGHAAKIASVPVWHMHEPTERLTSLAERFPTVALGSSGQWPNPGTDGWWERISEAMAAICDDAGRPMCKLHGLRMLNPDIFTRLPFASADSTNACQNAGAVPRFGMYAPPHAWQRAAIIADRIEGYNSAPCWVQESVQPLLWA